MIALFMAMRTVPGFSSVIYLVSFLIAFVFHVDLNSAIDGWSMLTLR